MKKTLLKRIATIILLVAAVMIILPGCQSAGKATAAKNTTLTVALDTDIVALDPAKAYDHSTNAVLLQIAEGLFQFDQSGKVQPFLVSSFTNPDPLTYVYKLKQNVKFSDGTPLTAEDAVFSLNRQKDPATASNLAWMFSNVDSITKTGDYEFSVKLKSPDALLTDKLATTAGLVISEKYYNDHKSDFGKATGGVLGSGPYIYKSWTTGSQIDLVKSNDYWDKSAKLTFDKIVYKVIPDESTRTQAALTGQADFAFGISESQAPQLEKSKSVNTVYADSLAVVYLTFNTKHKYLDDANARKAIYTAIDRDSIVKNIAKKSGTTANALLFDSTFTNYAPNLWKDYISNVKQYNYNNDIAKEYLKNSAYPNGFPFTLTYKGDTESSNIALFIQQTLKQIGIDVTLQKVTAEQLDADKFGGNLTNDVGNYDALIDDWISDFPDPDGDLTPMYATSNIGPGGSNDAGYSNAELDKILKQEIAETDVAKRAQLLQQAYDIAVDELPYGPLYYEKRIFAINNRLSGSLGPSWFYDLYFKDWKLK